MLRRSMLLLFFYALLSGCTEQSITILTVEFYSGAVVPNVTVSLIDAETEEVIETKVSNDEGAVTFQGVRPNHDYIVSNVSQVASLFVDSAKFTYEADMAYFLFETHFADHLQRLAVPIMQPPAHMKSAEALVALASVLHYYDVDVSIEEVYAAFAKQPFTTEGGVRIGGNPHHLFVGDVYTEESYVLAKPLAEAAVALIASERIALSVFDATSSTKEELLQIVENGVPIIAWVTKELALPQRTSWYVRENDASFSIAQNIEPVVIVGKRLQQLEVISQSTRKTYSVDAFYDVFTQLGAQAVVIRK